MSLLKIPSEGVIAKGSPQDVLRAPRQETIAEIVGFENLFDAVVLAFDERQGTMLCRLGNDSRELEVPLAYAEVGAQVRIAIRQLLTSEIEGTTHGNDNDCEILSESPSVQRTDGSRYPQYGKTLPLPFPEKLEELARESEHSKPRHAAALALGSAQNQIV